MAIDVTIKNYEAIPDLTLTISGFTGLTGLSNSGKSVFIRGIKSAIYNDSTERCINWNASEAKVCLNFRAPHSPLKIEWTRFRQTAEVKINDDQVFRKLGGQTPKPVIDYGFRLIGNKSPNFHLLEDTFFLLHEPVGVVADVFQEVLHFSKVSDALELCNGEKKKAVSKLNVRREDLTSAEQAAKEIPVLESVEQQIDSLLQTIQKQQDLQTTLDTVKSLEIKIIALSDTVSRLSTLKTQLRQSIKNVEQMDVLQKEEEVLQVTERVNRFSDLQHKLKWVTGIPSIITTIEELLNITKIGVSLNTVSTAMDKSQALKTLVTPAQATFVSYTEGLASLLSVQGWQEAHKQTEGQLVSIEKERQGLQDEFQQIQAKLAEVKTCPLCNNPFQHEEHP